jgi:hypothetical protein
MDTLYDGLERVVASKPNPADTLGAGINTTNVLVGPKYELTDMGRSAFQLVDDNQEILESGPHFSGWLCQG